MTRLRPFIALLLWLAAAALPAQTFTLNWEVNAGFSGFFRPGEWTPVMVLLDYTNPGQARSTAKAQDISGTLEVYTSSLNNKTILSQRPVEVPVSSRLRFMLYIQLPDTASAIEVILRNDRGQVIFTQPFTGLQALLPTESLTVVPVRNALSLRVPVTLDDMVDQGSLAKRAVVDPLHLPDHWFGYSGVNLLLMPRYDDNMLTSIQVDAIMSWVKSGGELWALGGQNTLNFQNQLIEEWLPVDITGTWSKDWQEPGQTAPSKIVVSDITPRAGAAVLAADPQAAGAGDARPLLVRSRLGNGRISFWAVDFADPMFAVSPFFQSYWWSLYPYEIINDHAQFFWPRFFIAMEERMGLGKAEHTPSLVLIFLFIVIYALLIGPVNFWMLARRRKLEWGWATVPFIIVVFTVLIYGYAYWFKGSAYLKRDFEVWRTTPGSSAVLRETCSFVFSPRRQQVEFGVNTSNGFATMLDSWDGEKDSILNIKTGIIPGALAGGGAVTGMTPANVRDVVQTNDHGVRIPRSVIDQWAPAYYMGRSLVEESSPMVEADISVIDRSTLKGTVKNSSPYDLSHAFVLFNRQIFRLDDMASGESVALERLGSARANADIFLGTTFDAQKGKDLNIAANFDEYAWIAMTQSSTTWDDFLRFANPASGEAVFIAKVKNPGLTPELDLRPTANQTSRHTLLVCPLPLRMEPGAAFSLQGAEVKRAILYAPKNTYQYFYVTSSTQNYILREKKNLLSLSEGSATFMLTTPLDESGRLPSGVRIVVRTNRDGARESSSNAAQTFIINVFNFSTGRWNAFNIAPLEAGNEFTFTPPLNPAGAYMSPVNGCMFIRLDSFSDSNNRLPATDINDIDVTYDFGD